MGVFENFPYTNFHELNLDWLIEKVKEFSDAVDYVKNFDVEEEVSTKLDQMLADGDLTNLLGDFPERLAAEEAKNRTQQTAITALQTKTTWNGSSEYSESVTCAPETETTLIDHVVTSSQAGRVLILAYAKPQTSHDAIYNVSIAVWRNGELFAERTVRASQVAGGGVVNYNELIVQTGDRVYLRVTQRYADASVDFRGALNILNLFN